MSGFVYDNSSSQLCPFSADHSRRFRLKTPDLGEQASQNAPQRHGNCQSRGPEKRTKVWNYVGDFSCAGKPNMGHVMCVANGRLAA